MRLLSNNSTATEVAWDLLGGVVDAAWWTMEWDPIVGCTPLSTGCIDCPVITDIKRMTLNIGKRCVKVVPDEFRPSGSLYARQAAADIVRCCDNTDLFHESVPFVALLGVLTAVYRMPHKLFFIRTKRPAMLARLLRVAANELEFVSYLSNLWIGVSVEDQFVFNPRVDALLSLRGQFKRWLSYEPAIGGVTSDQWRRALAKGKIGWVTGCGEITRAGSRPTDPLWLEDMARACERFSVPLWHIGNGSWVKKSKPSVEAFGDMGAGYHVDYTILGREWRSFPVDIASYATCINNRIRHIRYSPPAVGNLPRLLREGNLGQIAPIEGKTVG